MTYEQIKDLKPDDFKRACGVHPQTFDKMLHVLREHVQKKIKPGRPAKLSLEDQLFMPLHYWREYRTCFQQNPQSSRQNSRPSHQIEESFLSCESQSFRLKFGSCT